MKCPKCGGKMDVTDSRERDSGTIYRRRWCRKCGARFSTKEYITDSDSEKERQMQERKK